MSDLTPRDDTKKAVSEILKRVDQLLKSGSLEEARKQIAKAKEMDPRNVYVFAYEERLSSIFEEKRVTDEIEAKRRAEEEAQKQKEEARRTAEEEKRKAEEEARKKAEEEQRRKDEERRRAEEAERQKAEEKVKREEEQLRKAEVEQNREEASRAKIDDQRRRWEEERTKSGPKQAQPKGPVPEVSREVLEDTKKKILEERKKKGLKFNIPPATYNSAYEEGLDIYRRVLSEAWADGATTPDEETQLRTLRASLMISQEDHDRLDREAKMESYTNAFRRAWSSGAISPESASALADLRKQFKISMEDHEQIETQLLWDLRSSSRKGQILIIDDDAKLLRVIADTLEDAGYQTMTFTTSDEAFTALKTVTPDMIISDINLETSTMGGFSFYEKVREVERLQDIPFIFLSGLTDEVLIRTGKELGVDDYLTKPFSNDNLIATIKGKLKRYQQLKKNRGRR